jgi:hypothetical protein
MKVLLSGIKIAIEGFKSLEVEGNSKKIASLLYKKVWKMYLCWEVNAKLKGNQNSFKEVSKKFLSLQPIEPEKKCLINL